MFVLFCPLGGFSQEELLKIWKGLFYCMWVQDEPLLQEELADTISQLVHVVNNSEAQHLFIQTFWQTMNREWKGIDRLRLGKYCMVRSERLSPPFASKACEGQHVELLHNSGKASL